MPGTWAEHYAVLQGLLAQHRPKAKLPDPPAKVETPDIAADVVGKDAAWWESEGATKDGNAVDPGPYGGFGAAAPNISVMSQGSPMGSLGGRAAMTAMGMANPALGFGLGLANTVGNIANTNANIGMLNDLGVQPGGWSQVGGYAGLNPLAGTYTGALDYAMASQMPGFANLSVSQMPGDYSTGGWGGWSDIAQAMGPTASAQELAQAAANNAPGAIEKEDLGSYQRGGYTGAGADGVVQPWKKAGTVHEGELVIPAWLLRGMLGR